MSAFYIHIPYCRQACIYCNFHFSTNLKSKDRLLSAIKKEIILKKDYAPGETIETIYFGGGTPSLLSGEEIENIIEPIRLNYKVAEKDVEITLEANPDDLTFEKLKELKTAGINRLSIGIQSFNDHDLKWLNRVHNASQSFACIENAHKVGFENITIDLIYGIPGQSDTAWLANLNLIKNLGLPHFSAYALTVEPKTALNTMIKKGTSPNTDDDQMAIHFRLLQNWALQNDYLAYEISNYCRPGRFSRHNSSYWQGKKYIGIGPSAHSFNQESRQWNMANNELYIKHINENEAYFEIETLSVAQQYNEYVMTSLRTIWGCSKTLIQEKFGKSYLAYFEKECESYFKDNLISEKDNTVYLTMAGKLLADKISSDLFMVTNDQE